MEYFEMSDYQRPGARLPGPTVLRLVSQHEYSEAIEALEERPQDAYYEGRDGDNALHVMCRSKYPSSNTFRAIESILNVDPKLVERPNQHGWTPLHVACGRCWDSSPVEEIVLRMIDACPSAVSRELPRNLLAKTPFHLACAAGASAAILTAMLGRSPDLATRPYLQVSEASTTGYPLFLVWNSFSLSDKWSKMELLLKAATGVPLPTTPNERQAENSDDASAESSSDHFDVLNAACRVNPCPSDYLSLLLQKYPNRASWVDQRGLLPLHHVILNANKRRLHWTEEFLLRRLLQLYPTGASCPFGDMKLPVLPLHYFINDSNADWPSYGIDDLVAAYPDALRIPDPRNGLVPALASAPFAIQSRAHLTATYKLLLKSPEIFENST